MIKLAVSNGRAYIWNAKDWLTLREEHRIVGELMGCLAYLPRQETLPGLPLALLPEEVTLLVEQKVAELVQYPCVLSTPSEEMKQKFKDYREKLRNDEIEHYTEERKLKITGMIDSIVEGKRRKLLGIKYSKRKKNKPDSMEEEGQSEQVTVDKDEILREEIAKIKPMDENNTAVQIFTAHPWLTQEDEKEVEWTFPQTDEQKLRYQTFKHLWKEGNYITAGQKFGVDFLVYPGDPIKFHAQYLVLCVSNSFQIPILDLVALGRLGTSVRKTVVFASFSAENTIVFQSLTWNGHQDHDSGNT